jgi:hypothetical protein
MKQIITSLLLFISIGCYAQRDDTVYVTKLFIEPGKVVKAKMIIRKGEHWYLNGKRVEIIMYKLRDGNSDEWIIWKG